LKHLEIIEDIHNGHWSAEELGHTKLLPIEGFVIR